MFFQLLLLCLLPIVETTDIPAVQWLSDLDYEFEEITQGEPVYCYFRFKNITDTPIIIDNVRTTCGCTAPDWSPTPIAPNEVSEIKVIYDAKKVGYFKKKIRVYFSHQKRAELLSIQGYVSP